MSEPRSILDAAFHDLAFGRFSRAQHIIIGTVARFTAAGLPAVLRFRELGRQHGIDHHYLSRALRDLIAMGVVAERDGGMVYAGSASAPTAGYASIPTPGAPAHPPGYAGVPTPGSAGAPTPGMPALPNGGASAPLSPHTPLSGNPDQTTTSDSRGGTGAGSRPAEGDEPVWTPERLAKCGAEADRLFGAGSNVAIEVRANAQGFDPHCLAAAMRCVSAAVKAAAEGQGKPVTSPYGLVKHLAEKWELHGIPAEWAKAPRRKAADAPNYFRVTDPEVLAALERRSRPAAAAVA